jgi:hypothetical protein
VRAALPGRFVCPDVHKHEATSTCYQNHRCRCFACCFHESLVARSLRDDKAAGISRKIDAAPVREHILALNSVGIGVRRVAQLAGLHLTVVTSIKSGRRGRAGSPQRWVSRATSDAILGIPIDPMLALGCARIAAGPTMRRLHALQALGWSGVKLGARLGIEQTAFSRVQLQERVTTAFAKRVAALYDEISMTRPPRATVGDRVAYTRAVRSAAARGWAPPLAWDDIDNDEAPTVVDRDRTIVDDVAIEEAIRGQRVVLTSPERAEAIRRLNAAALSDAQIAARLHPDVRSVLRIRQKHQIAAVLLESAAA